MNHLHQNPYIQYFQKIYDEGTAPSSFDDFVDCLKFKELMTAIPDFPTLHLEPNPTTFTHIFSNLKELYKKIEEYWNDVLDRELQNEEIDLVDIAHNRNHREITKVLDLIIQSLVMSSHRDFFVQKMLETSEKTQQFFMKLVESTLEQRKTFSPRKQRQQRLYDKMIELDHENENLQNVISHLCQQKIDMQQKYKLLQDKIAEKDEQLFKANEAMQDFLQTPKKNRNPNLFDTQEKTNEFVERLKQKIIQMTKDHEKQLIEKKQQLEFYETKMQRVQFLENQIQSYKVRFESTKQALGKFQEISCKYSQAKMQLMEKNQNLEQYARKLKSKNSKIQQMEEKLIQKDLQIERKNVQLEEYLNGFSKPTFDDPISNFSSISLHQTLSEHCPQIANGQAEFLYQSNKKLREQLERASQLIKDRQAELERYRRQSNENDNIIVQNRKLSAIIEKMSEQNEEEKFLLLGCMHELRVKFLNEIKPKEILNRKQETKKLSSVTGKPLPLQRKRVQA